jgi:hypothetical protein
MSRQQFATVIGQACVDASFRDKLKSDAAGAAQEIGCWLNEDEVAMLEGADLDGLDAFAAELAGKSVAARGEDCWMPHTK